MNAREAAIKMRKQFQMFPNLSLDSQKCTSDKPAKSWKLWNRCVVLKLLILQICIYTYILSVYRF